MRTPSRVRAVFVLAAMTVGLVTACNKPQAGSAVPAANPSSTTAQSPAASTSTKPSATTSKPKPTTTTVASDPSGNDVIGPDGWMTLKLGMTPSAAEATGMFSSTPTPDGTCGEWIPVSAAAITSVIVSPDQGVVAIVPKDVDWMHTPEGMHLGMTAAQVHATYPKFAVADAHAPNGPVVVAPTNPKAGYRMNFSDADKLVRFQLESLTQNCYA